MSEQKYSYPPINDLRELLSYDANTGDLYWLPRKIESFESSSDAYRRRSKSRWDSLYANKKVNRKLNCQGYRSVYVFGRHWNAHRIAWMIYYGEHPEGDIDHINGRRDDNRIENLRSVSRAGNSLNRRIPRCNTSGHMGVWKRGGKWVAYIGFNKRHIVLGTFDHIEDALKARKDAELAYGFHSNHGNYKVGE